MTAKVPVKFLFEVSSNIVSGNDSAKKGTQLSLIEESYINKESEKQFRFRYNQFISVAVSRLKCKTYCWVTLRGTSIPFGGCGGGRNTLDCSMLRK